MARKKVGINGMPINKSDDQAQNKVKLTKLEKLARRESSQSIRIASFSNPGGASIKDAGASFYSPQLSTDFLELPQSSREKRELFRFWYVSDPIVGAAIDFHCFPPGAPVMMIDGSCRPIESLRAGDEVLNGFGEPTKVLQNFQHDISGSATRLKVRGVQGFIDCTDNHPFLVYRHDVTGKFDDPKFIFAKDIKEGDNICSPLIINTNIDEYVSINGMILRRVEKVEFIQYYGPVYNIEVEGNGDRKSYIAYGLSTHNTDVPMSKIRLSLPKGKDIIRNKQILHFYQQMCRRVRLFQTLYDMTHEYWLHGYAYVFAEDHDMTEELPEELVADELEEEVGVIDFEGSMTTRKEKKKKAKPKEERDRNIREYVAKHYRGWERLQILPPEQVKMEVFQYTNRVTMELIPSQKDRSVVMRAMEQGDIVAQKIADDIPSQIKDNLLSGEPIPLNTTPYDDFLCSSFCYQLAHKKAAYDECGTSIIERCHIPGTAVTAKRDGQIVQISIENLNSNTDLVLGGSGNWRKFELGSRPFSGDVVTFKCSKNYESVTCTYDHGMQVLRDGKIHDIEASELKIGDYIQVANVDNDYNIDSINLHEFFNNSVWEVKNRDNKYSSTVNMNAESCYGNEILTHTWVDKNSQRNNVHDKLIEINKWIKNIDCCVILSRDEFCEKFSVTRSVYRRIISYLKKLNCVEIIRSDTGYKQLVNKFIKSNLDVNKLYEKQSTQICLSKLYLTKELGYIIGYWLGDGWIQSRKTPTQYGPMGICYGRDIEKSLKSVELIEKYFGNIGITLTHIKGGKLGVSIINSDWFSRFISRNFGNNKLDKHIPDWVFHAPVEFKLGILGGLTDSDGWVYKNKNGGMSLNICMTTKNLIDQLFLLSYSVGLAPSHKYKPSKMVKQSNGSISKSKPQYTIAFYTSSDIHVLHDSGSIKLDYVYDDYVVDSSTGNGGLLHKKYDGHTYVPVKSIDKYEYNGDVFSLNVDVDHTFYTQFLLTKNCLRTLLYRDKIRQAQTSIASRAMTPKRVVWADKMSLEDVDDLRDQIEQALIDPDFTVVANCEIHWDEVGARDRLLDLGSEYEITNKLLFIGLRITESMLTGESSYSGERIHLDVMNTMYLLYRETVAEYVEECLFAPVAEKKGFYEIDEYGNKNLLYPKLQFTRLALRDNTELLDFMFNLYQKGSIPISYILELLNVDSDDSLEQLKHDMFTPNDSTYNDFMRAVLQKSGETIAEKTDVVEKLAKSSGLTLKQGDGRFDKE